MITVGYISKINDVHYFYSIVGDIITPQSYSGPEGPLKHKLIEMIASSLIIQFENFLLIDKEIIDPGKDVHAYGELRKRIQAYMDWAHDNIDAMPESVCDNGYISRKYMHKMINMISDDHQSKKDLVFLLDNVTQTYEVTYTKLVHQKTFD